MELWDCIFQLIDSAKNEAAGGDFAGWCEGAAQHARDTRRQFLSGSFENDGITDGHHSGRQMRIPPGGLRVERDVAQPRVGVGRILSDSGGAEDRE